MVDREKAIKGLECLAQKREPIANPCKDCGYSSRPNFAICVKDVAADALELLKEQEPHELTKEEWEQWKKDKRKDPICMIFYGDTTPFWVLRLEEINEPLYLMGKIKLFTKKPLKKQVKWDG